VSKAVAAVKQSRAGLADSEPAARRHAFPRPVGRGQDTACQAAGRCAIRVGQPLVTFDMSEYTEEHSVSRLLGAPPGYVGADEEGRLSAAVRNAPFSILLFDEIEKAHPRIFDIFLPIFDEAASRTRADAM